MGAEQSPSKVYSSDEAIVSHASAIDDVGGLTFDQYTQGGLGRHLGITSTTFLM